MAPVFTTIRRLPARLKVGALILLVLVAACFPLAAIFPKPLGADPVRCSLLPPGTKATMITRADGTFMAAPRAITDDAGITLQWQSGQTTVPNDMILATEEYRHWLGTDRFGRDVAVQLLRGGRISLAVAALSALIALILGTVVGIASATGGRFVDGLLMRMVDGLLAFPVLFLMILVAAVFRPGPLALILVLGATSWMGLSRLVRGQVLSLRRRPFVLAAEAAGSRWHRIWGLHYAPNLVGPLGQDTALRLGDLVIAEATLSYLGFGLPPSVPTWGSMIAQGHRVMLDGWWLATLPGLAIAALVVALALIGDGLQQLMQEDAA